MLNYNTLKNKFHNLLIILLGLIILSSWTFYNNYPFIFSDTGSYIGSGFSNWISPNRSIFYGWFIKHISLSKTLWFVVFAQSGIISYLVFLLFKYFTKVSKPSFFFLFTIIILTFFTGISLVTGLLIPDVFTAIAILSFGLFLATENLKLYEIIIITTIGFYSLLVHNSNLYIILFVLSFSTIYYFLSKRKQKIDLVISINKLLTMWGIIILSWITIPTTHYFVDGEFRNIKNTHVFLMGSLIDKGIIGSYLATSCKDKNYVLCEYKNKIPPVVEFLWDKKSPLYLTGGAEANKQEYNQIIKDALTTPKYFFMFIVKSTQYTIKQLFTFNGSIAYPSLESSSPYKSIKKYFPDELGDYLNSKQNKNPPINLEVLNKSQTYLFFSSIFLFLLFWSIPALNLIIPKKTKFLVTFMLLGVLSNAAICASFSMVTNRYQCRVVWLIPLMAILLVIEVLNWGKFKTLINKIIN